MTPDRKIELIIIALARVANSLLSMLKKIRKGEEI